MHDLQLPHGLFSSASLERHAERRNDANWADSARADPASRFVIARRSQQLVRSGNLPGAAFFDAQHPLVASADPERFLLLGWHQGIQYLATELQDSAMEAPPGTRFEELRPLLSAASTAEASILMCARALVLWRARQAYCGACGANTVARSAGHCMRCTNPDCGTDFFPRVDPAVIVVVSDGDHVLLGRQASWPAGRYSSLAGFVEVGESLEDAVLREVLEETGVRAHGPRYFASQGWPFPSSLMLGFHASATRGVVTLDDELEDARWFSTTEVEALNDRLLPPSHTIARHLIEHWYSTVTGHPLPAKTASPAGT
jgi:NAD+ diphosphatase